MWVRRREEGGEGRRREDGRGCGGEGGEETEKSERGAWG